MTHLLLLLAACGPTFDPLPDTWTLGSGGLTVAASRDPFSLAVYDATGQLVLQSQPAGRAEGYAPLAWTTGSTEWSSLISQGYYAVDTRLDPWHDDLVVYGAGSVDPGGASAGVALFLADRDALDAAGTGVLPGRPYVRLLLTPGPARLRVEATLQGTDDVPRAWGASFLSPGSEGFLGFGERFNRTDQRGFDVYSWAEEGGLGTGEGTVASETNPFPNGEAMSYYPVPFFVSTEGYGFWLDSTWWNEFNLGTTVPEAWRVWEHGPDLAFEVYLPTPADPRPWPYQLIDAFTERTGRPMVPPPWTFGPRRRVGSGSQVDGVPEVQAMRDEDLAITAVDDAVHFLPAGSHVGREDALAAWTAQARDLGYRVCAYYNPYVEDGDESALNDLYQEGVDGGYFLQDAEGEISEVWLISGDPSTVATVDFTHADATAWYQAQFDAALDLGYSGWMYDFGEYVQPDVLTASGLTGEQYHNQFPVDYHKAAFDWLESGDHAGDWLTFVRSGYTGDARYSPLVWTGDPAASFEDADGLPSMVRASVNLGVSGVPHSGGDINGFHCLADGYAAADEELLVRWIQQGAMSSNMQDQNACNGAMDEGEKADIWSSEAGREAWRTWARLHTRLFPYFYSLAWEAHETGAPVMRHLFLEHPDVPAYAAVDDTYYLGTALLVAPVVTRGARTRTVELPAGAWFDWYDQAVVQGGGAVEVDAPLDKLPLFLRDGHLLPLLDPTVDTLSEEDADDIVGWSDVQDDLWAVAFLSADTGGATYTLWDGETLQVAWDGGDVAADLPVVATAGEADTCASCAWSEVLDGGVEHVRLTSPVDTLQAGGLTVTQATGGVVHWDLYLYGGEDE